MTLATATQPRKLDSLPSLGAAWEVVMANPAVFIGGFLVVMLILTVAGFTYVGPLVLAGPLLFGLYVTTLKQLRTGQVEFGDVFGGFQQFLPAFLLGLVVSVFSSVGFFLCVIPGILVTIIYLPAYCILHDQSEKDFWQAMETARQAVMADFGSWALLFLLILVLNLVGAIPCGLGLIVTFPLSVVMITMAYEKAFGGPGTAPADASVAPPPPPA